MTHTTTKINYPNIELLTPREIEWEIFMLDQRIEKYAKFKLPDTLQLIKEKIMFKFRLQRILSSSK